MNREINADQTGSTLSTSNAASRGGRWSLLLHVGSMTACLLSVDWLISLLPASGIYSLFSRNDLAYLLLVGICGILGAQFGGLRPSLSRGGAHGLSMDDLLLRSAGGALTATFGYFAARATLQDLLGLVMADVYRLACISAGIGLATRPAFVLAEFLGSKARPIAEFVARVAGMVSRFDLQQTAPAPKKEPTFHTAFDFHSPPNPLPAEESLPSLIFQVCQEEQRSPGYDCAQYVRAVLLRLGIHEARELPGDVTADELLAWLRSTPLWRRMPRGDDRTAQQKAAQGAIVIAALSSEEIHRPYGELAVIVAGPLDIAHDRFPLAFWSRLAGDAQPPDHIHLAFAPPSPGRPNHLERIEYFARAIPRSVLSRRGGQTQLAKASAPVAPCEAVS
jgi:hypothetical protein